MKHDNNTFEVNGKRFYVGEDGKLRACTIENVINPTKTTKKVAEWVAKDLEARTNTSGMTV